MTQSMHEAPRLPSPAEPLCLLAMGPCCCYPSSYKATTKFERRDDECWDKQVPLSTRFRATPRYVRWPLNAATVGYCGLCWQFAGDFLQQVAFSRRSRPCTN